MDLDVIEGTIGEHPANLGIRTIDINNPPGGRLSGVYANDLNWARLATTELRPPVVRSQLIQQPSDG